MVGDLSRSSAQGWSLMELLVSGLLASLLLLAAAQLLSALLQSHARQTAWLDLERRAHLLIQAVEEDWSRQAHLVEVGAARAAYPRQQQRAESIQSSPALSFMQQQDSDWLLWRDTQQQLSLWHLDHKSYGAGLAHNRTNATGQWIGSQTLIPDVELWRVRLWSEAAGWQRPDQLTEQDQILAVHYAFVLVSAQPLPGVQSASWSLWGETWHAPQDGRLRQLYQGVYSHAWAR